MYLFEKKFKWEKWRGWDVLKERFNESLERLGCMWGKVQWIDGKVGMYLEEILMIRWKGWDVLEGNSMREWKGWDILEGMFNWKDGKVGCAWRKVQWGTGKVGCTWRIVQLKDWKEKVEEGRMKESSMRKNGKVGVCLGESSVRKWKGWVVLEGKFSWCTEYVLKGNKCSREESWNLPSMYWKELNALERKVGTYRVCTERKWMH